MDVCLSRENGCLLKPCLSPVQITRDMEHLLTRKLTGKRQCRVQEHLKRASQIAACIWKRFSIGPYQYQLKHLRWYLNTQTKLLKPATFYRHWLTVKNIIGALDKESIWLNQLEGTWRKVEEGRRLTD